MYSPSVSSSPGEARAPSLLVVCGLSGAGKSTVLQVLEDLDFFTADGLPPSLIPECCRMFSRPGMEHFRGMALGVDFRRGGTAKDLDAALNNMEKRLPREGGASARPALLFLEASPDVILRRYATTRRPHPLEREGMGLTLDGIAKGRIADIASRELAGAGLPNHLINAGGDIVASGEKAPETPWQVAVANPVSPHTGNARHGNAFALRNAALATSGSYEIYYDAEQRHHLISASTGSSPIGTISASALAPSATDADALATAFSVMPPRDALRLADKLPGCGCLLLSRDGSVLKSRGWPS